MTNAQDDAVFVRNFSLVLVGLVVVGIICFILAKIVNSNFAETQNRDSANAKRTAPAGTVNIGEPMVVAATETAAMEPAAPAEDVSSDPGKATYGKICFSCHDMAIAGAPKFADKAAWESRLEKGTEMMVMNAINGIQGEAGIMPARGGLPNLSDDEVRASVMYMLAAIGVGDAAAAPAEAAAAETPAPAPEPAPAAEPVAEAAPPAVADGRGKEVYDTACFICHATGVAGAPKFGDAGAWSSRVANGMESLYEHSIKGFMGEVGLMPPKGGRPDLSDDDVKAAVDYMVNTAK